MADVKVASVSALFVRPECEGRGFSRSLHDAMLDWLKTEGVAQVTLFTDPNTRAARFYAAAGWIRSGSTKAGDIV